MTAPLNIAVLVHIHASSQASRADLSELQETVLVPLLDAFEPVRGLQLGLHLSGPLLEFIDAEARPLVARLKSGVREGRFEMLGGGFYDPVMPLIPQRDQVGQAKLLSNTLEQLVGRRPEGCWLPLSAWDPCIIESLREAGLRWTLVDGEAFEALGRRPAEVHGLFRTERLGTALRLFPIDNGLSSVIHNGGAAAIEEALRQMTMRPQPPEMVTVVLDGDSLVRSGAHAVLVEVLSSHSGLVRMSSFQRALEGLVPRGTVYLGGSSWPALRPWCHPGADDEGSGPVVFSNVLARYPAADRLHKRMLRVSGLVQRLSRVVSQNAKQGNDVERVHRLLEAACRRLWRAQGHDVYWHGGALHLGLYDRGLRVRTLSDLLAAEKICRRLLDGRKSGAWILEQADFDGNGEDELLARTSSLQGLVDLSGGGTLVEFDLRVQGLTLSGDLSPILEPYHQATSGTEIQLIIEDEEGAARPEVVEDSAPRNVVPAMDRLAVPNFFRAAFSDHFLASETSLGSFARGQFRELGDFVGRPFERVAVSGGAPEGQVTVGRSGVVRDGDGAVALLRVEKTFHFDLDQPCLTLTHRVSNRSREAASVRHGLEWSFGVPSGAAERVRMRVQGPGGEFSYLLEDGAQEIPSVTRLEWQDPAAGLSILIELSQAQSLWWAPVQTVAYGPEGWVEQIQGNTLLFHSPLQLWGSGERELEIRISCSEI